jgi:hypothetical protein
LKLRRDVTTVIAIIADLVIYQITLILFVLLPIFRPLPGLEPEVNTLTSIEIVFAVVGVVLTILLIGRLLERPYIFLNQWAYLFVVGYGLTVLVAFLIVAPTQVIVPPNAKIVIGFTICIGIVGAAGAHLLDGGAGRPLSSQLDRYLRRR